MATLSEVAHRLDVEISDSDAIWECSFNDECSLEHYYLSLLNDWNPCGDVNDSFILQKFHRYQMPILFEHFHDESLFTEYVSVFEAKARVKFNNWKKWFCNTYKSATKVCHKRAFFCYLTMLPSAYSKEVDVLALRKTELVRKIFSKVGLPTNPIKRAVSDRVSQFVWSHGVEAGLKFVDTVVRECMFFDVEDLFRVIEHRVLKAEEVTAILEKVHCSLNSSDDFVKLITKDIVQPPASTVMEKTKACDIHVKSKNPMASEAYLCKHCNAFFLESEDSSSKMCCNDGKFTRFKLEAVPASVIAEIELRRNDGKKPYVNVLTQSWDVRDERMSTLARPINNYLSFATMHTTGFNEKLHKAMNLNSGIPDYMFRICGQSTSTIPNSVHNTLNAYTIDGISSNIPSTLYHIPEFIEVIRNTLIRCNPLAKAFRQWDSSQFENFNITIQGFEKGKQPKELGLLLHRPNVMCKMRTMDITLTDDHRRKFGRKEHITLRYDDAHVEPFQYPMLHFCGELGWGLSTRMGYDGKNNCSMRKYLRYRFMAGDSVEIPDGAEDGTTESASESLGMNVLSMEEHTGLPEIVLVQGSEPQKHRLWLALNGEPWFDCMTISTSRFHKLGLLGQQYLVDGYSRAIEFAASYEKYRQGKFKHKNDSFYLSSSFFGSPRFLKERKDNSLHLVNKIGMPLFFITVTCSENWAEFRRVLTMGQKASDSPVWVARVFNAKLNSFMERLRNGSLFYNCREDDKFLFAMRGGLGEIGYCIHVIEFQLRGMPHAHICFRPWNGAIFDKMIEEGDLRFVDKVATAQVDCMGV